MWFIGIAVLLILAHFLIIRPLTQRNRPQVFERPRYDYQPPREDYRTFTPNRGFGGMGTFAGGLAAGALLTYLFEQGRIGFDQYSAWQNLGDQEILRELMDQNILQEHEIAQLQEELNRRNEDSWNIGGNDNNQEQFDDNPGDNMNDQNGFDDWNNGGDDNWV